MTRRRRSWFQRAGTGTQLVAICLVAILLAGLVLIADGLLLKAEGEQADMRRLPGLFSEQGAAVAFPPPVHSR